MNAEDYLYPQKGIARPTINKHTDRIYHTHNNVYDIRYIYETYMIYLINHIYIIYITQMMYIAYTAHIRDARKVREIQ